MSEIDPRVRAALEEQLSRRPAGARRVGWKVGAGERERIGDDIVVGHLTSATVLESGSTYTGGTGLHADAEVAVEVGRGYAAALELVDLRGSDDPEEIVAANIFHRAVAFGPTRVDLPPGLEAALIINGEVKRIRPAADVDRRVAAVARILDALGEELRPGDRVITGSIVQLPVEPGDDVVADLGELGKVELSIA
jgi:2-keto-4-pentenoate hydratase